MTARRQAAAALAVLITGTVAVTRLAHAGPFNATPVPVPVVPVPVPVPPPSSCWVDVRLFETLRLGPVDFCRRNLRYRPGKLECYRFIDQVCMTWVPGGGWVSSRGSIDVQVFPCPGGPEPPVCRRLDLPSLP